MILYLKIGRTAFLFGALAKNVWIYYFYTKEKKITAPVVNKQSQNMFVGIVKCLSTWQQGKITKKINTFKLRTLNTAVGKQELLEDHFKNSELHSSGILFKFYLKYEHTPPQSYNKSSKKWTSSCFVNTSPIET